MTYFSAALYLALSVLVTQPAAAQVSGQIKYIASSGKNSTPPSPNPNGYAYEYEHETGMLYFTSTKSLYQQVQNKTYIQVRTSASGTERVQMPRPNIDTVGWLFVRDLPRRQLFCRDSFWNRSAFAYINEPLPAINWTIGSQQKKIGSYMCQQAQADFLGRHWIAWFAPTIPVGVGPWKLGGLPGAILEATDATKEFIFTAQEVRIPAQDALAKIDKPYFNKINWLTAEEFRKQYADRKQKHIRYINSVANENGGTMKVTFLPHLELL